MHVKKESSSGHFIKQRIFDVIQISGGTDGARLSFMGLPCPNLCAGGHNFHGRFEYVCAESMERITELLIRLAGK